MAKRTKANIEHCAEVPATTSGPFQPHVQQRSSICGNSELLPVWRHSFRNLTLSWHSVGKQFHCYISCDQELANKWARCSGKNATYIKAPAKRSQHANTTCRNIVRRNMLCAFGHPVATCCDMLGVVGSNLKIFHATFVNVAWCYSRLARFVLQCCAWECALCRNTSQQVGQTRATCCAQQCCDLIRFYQLGW